MFDALAIVIGTIIGSGIFLLPSFVAGHLLSFRLVLILWVVGGIISAFGALSLAELGAMFPRAGGLSVYLLEAYGPLPAFLYAWSLLLIIHSGSIAALSVALSLYASRLVPLGAVAQTTMSVCCIMILTAISCVRIRQSKTAQNFTFVIKLLSLLVIIGVLGAKGKYNVNLSINSVAGGTHSTWMGVGIAAIAILWAYEGWHLISFVAGEIKDVRRVLPLALIIGTGSVAAIYVTANYGYYHTLSTSGVRSSHAIAAEAMARVLGPKAAVGISIAIVMSVLGCMNGLIVTGPRVYYEMAREGAFPSFMSRLDVRQHTPVAALLIQGVWSSVLAVTGTYDRLYTNVIFTAWIFYGLAVAGVMVLRRKQPNLLRPYRAPGYPWVSVLFCAASLLIVLSAILKQPKDAVVGLGILCCGILFYYWRKPNKLSRHGS